MGLDGEKEGLGRWRVGKEKDDEGKHGGYALVCNYLIIKYELVMTYGI